jgi:hypothetical protein
MRINLPLLLKAEDLYPVVALNSALGFIKPLPIEAQPLNQRDPLDQPNSDL